MPNAVWVSVLFGLLEPVTRAISFLTNLAMESFPSEANVDEVHAIVSDFRGILPSAVDANSCAGMQVLVDVRSLWICEWALTQEVVKGETYEPDGKTIATFIVFKDKAETPFLQKAGQVLGDNSLAHTTCATSCSI